MSESEFGGGAVASLALPVLHELLDGLQRDLLLVAQRLDDLASLRQHVVLNQPLVRVLGVPLLADGHGHERIKLFRTGELVRQVAHPVLLRELLVALLRLVDLHSFELCVLALLFQLLNLLLPDAV